MKNLRFLLIGAVVGGAFGAKVGGYLAKILEVPATYNWIESGFIYGVLGGTLTVASFLIAFAIASYQKQMNAYSPGNMANA
ncbi:hypothetical protein [Ekhidna sp. To15]|uniref:hypothetical protein n=1 Tax=Ekhidna sp. To15 TaxID=3395267 RepID=UPI003F524912